MIKALSRTKGLLFLLSLSLASSAFAGGSAEAEPGFIRPRSTCHISEIFLNGVSYDLNELTPELKATLASKNFELDASRPGIVVTIVRTFDEESSKRMPEPVPHSTFYKWSGMYFDHVVLHGDDLDLFTFDNQQTISLKNIAAKVFAYRRMMLELADQEQLVYAIQNFPNCIRPSAF